MSKKKKTIIIVVCVVLVLLIAAGLIAFGIFNSMKGEELEEEKLNVNPNLSAEVYNIALFGTDGRNGSKEGRSDAAMIATINTQTGFVKVISVQRDLMVKIPATESKDVSYEKFTHAYMYGGEQLAVQTLNENFDLNITDYVVVNFEGLAGVVDAVGGIDVNIVNENVLAETNKNIHGNSAPENDSPLLTHIGSNHLDGYQALAYSRDRYSDSDYGRTERQREIIVAIAKKAMDMSMTEAIKVAGKIYPYVQTSLDLDEAIALYKSYVNAENRELSTGRMPYDGIRGGGIINGLSYVLGTTLADNVKVLHYDLYGDESYTPPKNVQEISNTVAKMSGMGSSVDWTITTPQNILNSQRTTHQ